MKAELEPVLIINNFVEGIPELLQLKLLCVEQRHVII